MRHGRASGWRWHGCRCRRCHAALLAEARITWAARNLRRGRDPATRVPAGPVRDRLAELEQAGLSRREVARRAQVAPATLSRLADPSTERVSRIVAAAVAGVEL